MQTKYKQTQPIAYIWNSHLKLYQEKFPKISWKPSQHIADTNITLHEESKKETSNVILVDVPIVVIPSLVQKGYIQPLENGFSEDELNRYLPLALRLLTKDGHLYGIPEDLNLYGFYRNENHPFSKKICSPSTWDDLRDTLTDLQINRNNQGLRINFNARHDNNGLIWSLFHSNGIEARSYHLDFHFYQKKLKAVFQFMLQLQDIENTIPEETLKNYSKSLIDNYSNPLFFSGWLKGLPLKMRASQRTRLLPFPKGNPLGKTAFPISGTAWVIPNTCQDQELAIKIIKEMHKSSFAKSNELKGNLGLPVLREFWQNKQIINKHPVLHSASIILDSKTKLTQDFFHNNIIHLAANLRNGLLNKLTADQWIQQLQSSLPGENLNLKNPALQKTVSFIGERLGILKNLDEIAMQASLSQNHLNHLFKKELGCTCWDYVIQLKMERAKELISSTQFSIKEISYQMGFKKASSFARSFQKQFGISPSSYRKTSLYP